MLMAIVIVIVVIVMIMIMLLLMKKSTCTIIKENHLQQATERGTLRSLDSAAPPLNATLEPESWQYSKDGARISRFYRFVKVGLFLLQLQHIFSALSCSLFKQTKFAQKYTRLLIV